MTNYATTPDSTTRKTRAGLNLADSTLEGALAQCARNNRHATLLVIDIAGFGALSKALTKEASAHIANAVSRRISASVRRTDLLTRTAAGRFTVLTDCFAAGCSIESISARLRDQIERPVMVSDIRYTPVVSVGVARFPNDAKTMDTLVDHAVGGLQRNRASSDQRTRHTSHRPTTLAVVPRPRGGHRLARRQL